MNSFKSLDTLFPCGKDRLSGEVVSISISIYRMGHLIGVISGKRKQWYVNASVNAWHLHRHLCKELKELVLSRDTITSTEVRALRAYLSTLVSKSYVSNYITDEQYHNYVFDVVTGVVSSEAGIPLSSSS